MKHRWDSRNARQVLALSLAIIASLLLLLAPLYTQIELKAGGPEGVSHPSLLETVGPSIFLPLLIPVALTALPLLMRERARVQVSVAATAALAVFVLIGSASIGWFYFPSLAAAVTALVASMNSRPRLQASP